MKILVVGNGAREHAIVWKLHQSKLVDAIYCAPGNPGIRGLATCVDIRADDIRSLLLFAREKAIDLTVPGPEIPLVAGIVDEFEAQGLAIFGPSQKAAALEGSKAFAKYFMKKYKIPTAEFQTFDNFAEAQAYAKKTAYPSVIKADGLAAGKGAIIVHHFDEADHTLRRVMIEKEFGDAGSKVVIEEFMRGEEASAFAVSDGENYVMLPTAQDHKALFDDDKGPNTGGMGAYAPAPVVDDAMLQRVRREIVEPTLRGMAMENRPYRGILYVGLMITAHGPKVVEYNCRFGDPEAQVILRLLHSDLVEVLQKAATRSLIDYEMDIAKMWALCVVMASGGYPGSYEAGKKVIGLDRQLDEAVLIFHSGTKQGQDGRIITAGGRVFSVTAVGDDLRSAREKAYQAVGKIAFDGAYYRKDIGVKALRRLPASE